jgi:tetratricopeptide (TPR) repeat protein
VENFAELVKQLASRPILTETEYSRVVDLLNDLPPSAVTEAFEHSRGPANEDLDIADVRAVVGHFEDQAEDSPDANLALLTFLEQAAHSMGAYRSHQVHQIIHDSAGRHKRDHEVSRICQELSGETPSDDTAENDGPGGSEVASSSTDSAVGEPAASTPGEDVRPSASTTPALMRDSALARTPEVMGGVPPRNPHFTGREPLLARLDEALHEHGHATILPHTLQGLGGVGKTQLAIEYVHRFQSGYELIWWVHSDDEQSIRRSLASLARRLGLPESNDVTFTIDTLLDELRMGHPYHNWLLVYDGASEPRDIRRYLPSGPGKVLVTSRSRTWVIDSTVLEVDVFNEEESREFLTRRWTEIANDEANALASELGHLPLALDQAVAVHRETGMPLLEYLRLLEESPGQMLDEGGTSDYPLSVAKTCQLAFKQLRERSPGAAQLLEVCSFISSQNIAVPMLVRGRGASLPSPLSETLRDDIKLRSAIRDIGRYALAQLDTRRDFIRIHMLIRALLRDALPTEQREVTERSAHELLALANPGAPDSEATWSQHRQVAPHVIPSGAIHSDDPHVRRIVLDQIRFFYVTGRYDESLDLAERAVETWHGSLGSDDEMTLVASFHLSNALRALGGYQRAREISQDTLRRMRRVMGPDHEHTLRMANSHGADLRLLGDFQQALTLDKENLGRYQKILSEDDPAVLRCANNLAVDYRLLGKFQEALEIDEQNLQQRRIVLGDSHPEVASSVSSVVRDRYGIGNYQDALELAREGVDKYADLLESHIFLLLLQRNLAVLLRKTGDHSEAVKVSEQIMDQCRSHLGPRHEHTLSAMVTLANSLRVLGDLSRALHVNEEAFKLYQDSFGREHAFTLACANNLTIAYRAVGRVEKAAELDRITLDALERILGANHPYTLCCLTNLSNDLSMAGDMAGARKLSEMALERSRQQRAPDHPYTLACAVNLAFDLDATGAKAEAAELRKDTKERMRRKLGPEHPETVNMERGRRAECDTEVPPT